MKRIYSIFGLFALSFFTASAQVTVSVSLDQNQFLPGETLPVTVHITNLSGQTLHLGADSNWLTFSVESADGFVVLKKSDPPVTGAFDLGSSEVATKTVDLAPYFALAKSGSYQVSATVRIKSWNTQIDSVPKNFDVIDGARLWSQAFGVPAPAGATNQPPEVRKYILEEANYLRAQLRMYVEVTDAPELRVFKVRAIGPMVSFSQPEAQLDAASNLHVLYQSGASSFIYAVVNPNGDILSREIYDYYNTRPRLKVDAAGNVTVVGGVRRIQPGQLPAVQPPSPAPAKPAANN